MSHLYGVTGATGQLGRLVINILKNRGLAGRTVALVRSPAKGADLGVALREADYNKPETLPPALAQVETLLLISSNEIGKRAIQHHHVIEAARQAGVKRIIYTSLLHADRSPLDLSMEHLATEAELQGSGCSYTILRNGWYTENHLGAISGVLARGALIGSAGHGGISAATRLDFAEAAVAALIGDGHEGRTYELAGDDAFTLSDLAAEISRQTGKSIPYQHLSEEDYSAALAGLGLPAPMARAIAGWDVATAQGALYDNGRQLSKLIGRPTTPLAAAVAAALKALVV